MVRKNEKKDVVNLAFLNSGKNISRAPLKYPVSQGFEKNTLLNTLKYFNEKSSVKVLNFIILVEIYFGNLLSYL
jgi:hypothetical protein